MPTLKPFPVADLPVVLPGDALAPEPLIDPSLVPLPPPMATPLPVPLPEQPVPEPDLPPGEN